MSTLLHALIFTTEYILVLPYKRQIQSLLDLTDAESTSLAEILSKITKRYDNLFSTSFAYSMGIHQRPVPKSGSDMDDHDAAHLHFHFYPPLLRSASVRKFLVGYVPCFPVPQLSLNYPKIGLNL